MSDELASCPFCGEIESLSVDPFDCEDREGIPHRVCCGSCGCHGPWEYERDGSQKCVAAWNRRAKPKPKPEPWPATKAVAWAFKGYLEVNGCHDDRFYSMPNGVYLPEVLLADFVAEVVEQGAE